MNQSPRAVLSLHAIYPARRGISLVETLVAVALFSLVAVSMLAAFTTLVAESRKSRTQKVVFDNLNATLGSMVRELRNGTNPVISPGGTRIQFEPSSGDGDVKTTNDQIVYTISENQVMRSLNGGGVSHAMSAPELRVEKLFFQQVNTDPDAQPTILITLVGKAGTDAKTSSSFALQTSVVSRGYFATPEGGNVCNAIVVSGFLSRLLFDDGAIGSTLATIKDESSTARANIHGNAQFTQGKWCNGLALDGVNDYVDYPDPRFLDLSNLHQTGFTVSAWVKPTSLTTPNPGKCGFWVDPITGSNIIDCEAFPIAGTDDVGSPNGWRFSILPSGSLRFTSDNGTARPPSIATPAGTISIGEWRHIAVTWDGQNSIANIKIYVDGDVEAPRWYEPDVAPVNLAWGPIDDSADSLKIGFARGGYEIGLLFADTYAHGAIDDFRIYNRVLSGGEIKDLAQNSSFSIKVREF